MLYCGDTELTVSENWNSSDAEELGITHVTEKRFYELFGQRRSIDIDYWTWKNERIENGVFRTYFYLKEQNDGLSISVFYNREELALLLENNTNMYIFIDLSTLIYKIPCSGVISRPAASTSCRSFFITSAGIHLRSTLTVRTRLRLRTMSIGA